MQLQSIATDLAPAPLGHYSQAVTCNDTVYVSGQLPIIPGTELSMPIGIENQARQTLENLRMILEAAGSGIDRIASVSIFIPDVSLWPSVNAVYTQFMGKHRPARTVVPTTPLHLGALIEISAVAAK